MRRLGLGLIAMALAACGGGGAHVDAGAHDGPLGADGGPSIDAPVSAPDAAPCEPTASCTAGHTCLNVATNGAANKIGLRMAQLTFAKPAALASGLVASTIANGVEPALAACNVNGAATTNWLLQLDTSAGTLTTGGAKPVADPTAGYTFVNETLMQGGQTFQLQPTTEPAMIPGDGTFFAEMGANLMLPLYLDAAATQVLLLPMHLLTFSGHLSADHDCVGRYNAAGLDPANSCQGDATHPTFVEDASIHGYISLEDADVVTVGPLNQSLCVVLSGDAAAYGDGGSPAHCKRTGGSIVFTGDWCSTTNTPGGCADALELAGNFAASGVAIH